MAEVKPVRLRDAKVARNCAHWTDGRCERCGVQWQYFEVDAGFRCPHFRLANPTPSGGDDG